MGEKKGERRRKRSWEAKSNGIAITKSLVEKSLMVPEHVA